MTTESVTTDPYEVLGVRSDASDAQIRKAWRKRTDAAGPGSAEFAALNQAAELLLDEPRRKAYDAEVAAKRAEEARAALAEAAPLAIEDPAPEPWVAADELKESRVRRTLSGWNGTVTVAGVLAVVAVALAIWQGVDYSSNNSSGSAAPGTGGVAAGSFNQSQSLQSAVLSTVQTGLPAVLSYSYDSMAADQANAERFLAPSARPALASNYQRLISGGTPPGCKNALPPIATRQTVVTATVVQVGIVSVSSNTAQVGAFVNQTTTAAKQAKVTTQNRVLVSLVNQNGAWLISSMTVPNTDHVLSC